MSRRRHALGIGTPLTWFGGDRIAKSGFLVAIPLGLKTPSAELEYATSVDGNCKKKPNPRRTCQLFDVHSVDWSVDLRLESWRLL